MATAAVVAAAAVAAAVAAVASVGAASGGATVIYPRRRVISRWKAPRSQGHRRRRLRHRWFAFLVVSATVRAVSAPLCRFSIALRDLNRSRFKRLACPSDRHPLPVCLCIVCGFVEYPHIQPLYVQFRSSQRTLSIMLPMYSRLIFRKTSGYYSPIFLEGKCTHVRWLQCQQKGEMRWNCKRKSVRLRPLNRRRQWFLTVASILSMKSGSSSPSHMSHAEQVMVSYSQSLCKWTQASLAWEDPFFFSCFLALCNWKGLREPPTKWMAIDQVSTPLSKLSLFLSRPPRGTLKHLLLPHFSLCRFTRKQRWRRRGARYSQNVSYIADPSLFQCQTVASIDHWVVYYWD